MDVDVYSGRSGGVCYRVEGVIEDGKIASKVFLSMMDVVDAGIGAVGEERMGGWVVEGAEGVLFLGMDCSVRSLETAWGVDV